MMDFTKKEYTDILLSFDQWDYTTVMLVLKHVGLSADDTTKEFAAKTYRLRQCIAYQSNNGGDINQIYATLPEAKLPQQSIQKSCCGGGEIK